MHFPHLTRDVLDSRENLQLKVLRDQVCQSCCQRTKNTWKNHRLLFQSYQ